MSHHKMEEFHTQLTSIRCKQEQGGDLGETNAAGMFWLSQNERVYKGRKHILDENPTRNPN